MKSSPEPRSGREQVKGQERVFFGATATSEALRFARERDREGKRKFGGYRGKIEAEKYAEIKEKVINIRRKLSE